MSHTELRETALALYRAIEQGDRQGVAALCGAQLRVEGIMAGEWAVWDRQEYLGRVEPFRAWIGEQPQGRVQSVRILDGHGVVEGSLRWSTGGFRDTLVFGKENGRWSLRHKTFAALAVGNMPFDLYTSSGPNGYKVAIALEELGLDYETHSVDLAADEQFKAPIHELNPNHKVPVLVDRATKEVVFESNAILLYLADHAAALVPPCGPARSEALQWLFFQAASLGPMLGQRGHFEAVASEKHPYAIERYAKESERLYDVLERRLRARAWILSDYSIVDISCFAWLYCVRAFGFAFEPNRPALGEWFARISSREAVQRGLAVPKPFFLPQP